MLNPALVAALAVHCAPSVAPLTLLSMVQVESAFDPWAIGVNGQDPERLHPTGHEEAVAAASRLIAGGANIDLGLVQINSGNLAPLGLSVADTFDPCKNLQAAGVLLQQAYDSQSPAPGREQIALRTALSIYNTGRTDRGFRNGYVAKVTAAVARLVPALQPDAAPAPRGAPASAEPSPHPQAWDVFAQTRLSAPAFVFAPSNPGDQP